VHALHPDESGGQSLPLSHRPPPFKTEIQEGSRPVAKEEKSDKKTKLFGEMIIFEFFSDGSSL